MFQVFIESIHNSKILETSWKNIFMQLFCITKVEHCIGISISIWIIRYLEMYMTIQWKWEIDLRTISDRVPDELWMEVHDIGQETGIKTIPLEKICKKTKWLLEEALQIAVKRREVKSKGEKESYTHLNAEFQRIARRDKKAFLSNQCKYRGKQYSGKD